MFYSERGVDLEKYGSMSAFDLENLIGNGSFRLLRYLDFELF